MKSTLGYIALSILGTVAQAAEDPTVKLTKSPVGSSLDPLYAGLNEYLPKTQSTMKVWDKRWFPEACKSILDRGIDGSPDFRLTDFTVYDVTYEDCGSPWAFCHHNDAPIDIQTMASTFGQMPIQMREYVRNVMVLPNKGAWAFETDGVVTFLGKIDNLLNVVIHETGHSLDLNGAYADKPLSSSQKWWSEYGQDGGVPDNYAQSSAVEDVAQNTVVAAFAANVPMSLGEVLPEFSDIFHQYATVLTEARNAGRGHSIIMPGEGSTCRQRLPASSPVPISNSVRRRGSFGEPPNVAFPDHIKLIDTSHRINKHSGCRLGRH